MLGAPSATVLAALAATMLAWHIGAVVSVLVAAVEALTAPARARRIAVRRVRAKWARFRLEHPEVF